MPLILVPFVAVVVALFALVVAYALTVLFTPILEGLARNVPVVGGYIERGLKAALDYAGRQITSWANEGVGLITGWLSGLGDSLRDFVGAVNAYLVELPALLDHLLHVSVHEVVKSFVNPVRATANAAESDANAALAQLAAIAELPLSHFKGIDHGVETALDRLHTLVRNVDLPDTLDQSTAIAGGLFDIAAGEIGGLRDLVNQDVGDLWDFLGRIPLQDLLGLLSTVPVLAELVRVIEAEAGLGNAACRAKVGRICATDPAAWEALLDIAGVALLWMGLTEFVQLARDFASETTPAILELLRGG